ncbi:MAG: glycosyltransferase family 2 protein [Lachnospiraceae bacterium]|nr:glycosyltransferase family 2 protein [Lachnospiraceae bacterium]
MKVVNISIIMPVYNTANYLKESLGSLLRQTYTEFELICVNDASTDDSFSILREFQQRDARLVIVEHDINRGAAVSRNDGLKIAKGEYVIFLDSDDYFYQDMLEVSYQYAVEKNADIVIFGSETMENGVLRKASCHYQCIDSVDKKLLFLPTIRHVPWDKLVKKRILLDHKIWFQDIPTNNDIFYSFAVILMAERIIVCSKELLQYRYGRLGSLTNKRFSGENYTVDAFYALFRFWIRNKMESRLAAAFINLIADNLQLYLSEELYPLKMRRESLEDLLNYKDMINTLSRYEMSNALYPHNRQFVRSLVEKRDVCNMKYFQFYLDSVEEIIKEKRKNGEKIALWGCGQNGRMLLKLLDSRDVLIDYVIDENQEIQGKACGRYQIQSYDEIADKISTVFITNMKYKEAIEEKATGKEVIYVWK